MVYPRADYQSPSSSNRTCAAVQRCSTSTRNAMSPRFRPIPHFKVLLVSGGHGCGGSNQLPRLRVPFTHVIPPKRHHAVPAPDPRAHLRDSEEVLAELTKLGCLNPLAVERQRERGAMLERLEGRIGVAVGSLWACWGQHSGAWCAIWWRRWKRPRAWLLFRQRPRRRLRGRRWPSEGTAKKRPRPRRYRPGGLAAADIGVLRRAHLADSVAVNIERLWRSAARRFRPI